MNVYAIEMSKPHYKQGSYAIPLRPGDNTADGWEFTGVIYSTLKAAQARIERAASIDAPLWHELTIGKYRAWVIEVYQKEGDFWYAARIVELEVMV